jgi:hypothetical protein
MKTELLSADTAGRIARIRLEGWLSLHRPTSIPDYVDRVFARTVQVRDAYADAELSSLLVDRARFVDRLVHELKEGVVCSHLVDALRLTWVFRRHGIPRHELEFIVAPLVERFESAADAWDEPERSDFFYWAGRLGWSGFSAAPFEAERKPLCDLAELLRRCDYGETRLERAQASLHSSLLKAVLDDTESSPAATAMLLAGTLWVESALDTPSAPHQEELAKRLFALQDDEGAFPGASRHRASCVALVALSRSQGSLPTDRNLG